MIMAIDPGPTESAFVYWNGESIPSFGKVRNDDLLGMKPPSSRNIYIEMVASYGMPVGRDVFETALWVGRFIQRYEDSGCACCKVYRKDIKLHLCGSTRAKDSNVTAAIVDRYDSMRTFGKHGKGTKKNPGMFYGFAKDHWAAFAVALYSHDMMFLQGD